MKQQKRRVWPIRVLEFVLGLVLAVVGVVGLVYYSSLLFIPLGVIGIMGLVDSMTS
jgi:hypothetical protein